MSERAKHSHEQHESLDDSFFEEHKKSLEEARERSERQPSHPEHSIESILETIEKSAETTEALESRQEQSEHKPTNKPLHIGESLHRHGYQQSMKKIQKQLPSHQRAYSKFIHHPAVETTSEIVGQTVARPSGLLVGGVFSVIANLLVIFVCRYYGYEYNYLIGLVAFAGGFVVGLVIEAVYRATRHSKSR